MFEGVWWNLILALVGGGAFTTGVLGLAMGGDLPYVRVPDSLKPLAKFCYTLALFIGMTLLVDKGTPDLAGSVVSSILP